jgi:hypothetical protein
MTGPDDGVLREREELALDSLHEEAVIAAREVGSADAAPEEGVAGDHRTRPVEHEDDVSRRVPWDVTDDRAEAPGMERLAGDEVDGARPRLGHDQTERQRDLGRGREEGEVVGMEPHGDLPDGREDCVDGADVVEVGVSEPDLVQAPAARADAGHQPLGLRPRVDQDGVACRGVGDEVGVRLDRPDRQCLDVERAHVVHRQREGSTAGRRAAEGGRAAPAVRGRADRTWRASPADG